MRMLLLLGSLLFQGCITSAMWSDYGAEKEVETTSIGEARIVSTRLDPRGPTIYAEVELLDDQQTLRSELQDVRSLLALTPRTRSLPVGLLRTGKLVGCRLDEVHPYLEVRKDAEGKTTWNMRVSWRGQCSRIAEADAPAEYRELDVLRERDLDSTERDVVDYVWSTLSISGLQGVDRARREAVGWLDEDGNVLRKRLSPGLPAFLLVRLRTDNDTVSYVEIPTMLLVDPGDSRLSGGHDALLWSYRDDWAAEPNALAPPGVEPLAAGHRTANFSYEHVQVNLEKEGGLVWRILMTPVTVAIDIPLLLFWAFLDAEISGSAGEGDDR